MTDFADDVALQSGNGCCRVDRIACAGVENRGKKRKSTKRCGLDRLNLIYASTNNGTTTYIDILTSFSETTKPPRKRPQSTGVPKVFLRIARKSILFEQKT